MASLDATSEPRQREIFKQPIGARTKIFKMKFNLFRRDSGITDEELAKWDIDRALEAAIVNEEFAKKVGPFDQAFNHFSSLQNRYTKLAEFLEQRKCLQDELERLGMDFDAL